METITIRHEPTDECDGKPITRTLPNGLPLYVFRCQECGVPTCSCETSYGHDCEV